MLINGQLPLMQLMLFGGHGTGGWLSRYDVYYNDCVVLDRGAFIFTIFPSNYYRFLGSLILLALP